MGAEDGSLAESLGVCYELNASVCSILGATNMCSMVVIDHLAWAAPLDEEKMGVLVFGLIGIVLIRDCWDQCRTALFEYVAHHIPSLVGE